MALGRPTLFTHELATEICRRIAQGDSLRYICSDDKMPNKGTVLRWVIDGEHKEFSDQYAKAREVQAEILADEIFDIADDGSNDYYEKKNTDGSSFVALDAENIGRSRLRVDSRKWYLSKVLPKKFGEKVVTEHSGPDGGPIQLERIVKLVG